MLAERSCCSIFWNAKTCNNSQEQVYNGLPQNLLLPLCKCESQTCEFRRIKFLIPPWAGSTDCRKMLKILRQYFHPPTHHSSSPAAKLWKTSLAAGEAGPPPTTPGIAGFQKKRASPLKPASCSPIFTLSFCNPRLFYRFVFGAGNLWKANPGSPALSVQSLSIHPLRCVCVYLFQETSIYHIIEPIKGCLWFLMACGQ